MDTVCRGVRHGHGVTAKGSWGILLREACGPVSRRLGNRASNSRAITFVTASPVESALSKSIIAAIEASALSIRAIDHRRTCGKSRHGLRLQYRVARPSTVNLMATTYCICGPALGTFREIALTATTHFVTNSIAALMTLMALMAILAHRVGGKFLRNRPSRDDDLQLLLS